MVAFYLFHIEKIAYVIYNINRKKSKINKGKNDKKRRIYRHL